MPGTKLVNRATGERELVDDADVQSSLASGKYEQPDAVAARVGGEDTYLDPTQLQRQSAYAQAIDPARAELAKGAQIRAERNTGLVAGAKAVAGGAVSGITLGIANPFEEAQEFNPGLSIGGQLLGGLAPGLFGDEAGIATAIAKDGAATERVGGALSSKFLYAGDVGEGAGKGLESALAGAGEHLENVKAVAALPEDLGTLDAAGLRGARDAELDRLASGHATDRAVAKSAAVDDVLAYQKQLKDANPFLVASEGPASAPFAKQTRILRNALDDVEGLRENPASLVKPLRLQAQAIEKTLGESDAIGAKFAKVNGAIAKDLEEDLATLPDTATHLELAGKAAKRYGAYADVKVGKTGTLSIAREDAQGFLDAIKNGDVQGQGQQALAKLGDVLQANKALQAKLKAAAAPALARTELTSSRLTAIDAARDALATPKTRSLGEEMLGGSIMGHVAGAFSGMPIIGPMIGAKAGKLASDLVFGRLGKTASSAAARTKGALDTFLNVAKRATPTLPVAATRVLAGARFAPAAAGQEEPKKGDLHALWKARTDEIKSQTMYAPDGSVQVRPEARQAIADRLAPLRAASPILADRLETLAARRLQYLSSIMPRRPDIGGIPVGPDTWRPSELEMRSWARSLSAVEDPHGVEERLARGQCTPEEASCYHAVYPERAEALKQQIMLALPTLSKKLPYERRLALSIFSGVPVDPSLNPTVLASLQQQFAAEEGTEGGTQAPKAKPAFGSVRSDIGTASQQRESVMR